MQFTRLYPRRSELAVAGLAAAMIIAPCMAPASAAGSSGPAAAARAAAGPTVKLEATSPSVSVDSFQGTVLMDPGIWVASLGSALQFNVRRASYTQPVAITQIIHLPGGQITARPLPAGLLDGWNGLKGFIRMTVRDRDGKVVASPMLTFCPNTFYPQRASPQSPAATPYPQQCGADPFPKSMVWGMAQGWATDPAEDYPPSPLGPGPSMRLPPGKYQVTETVSAPYVRLFHMSARDTSKTVEVTVVQGHGCCAPAAGGRDHPRGQALPSLPRVSDLVHPPKAALPDLVPLPPWGISTSHTKSGR